MNRLKQTMTVNERKAARIIYQSIQENGETINAKQLAKEAGMTPAMFNNVLRLLYICNIVDYRSMGVCGTYVMIEDEAWYKEVIK